MENITGTLPKVPSNPSEPVGASQNSKLLMRLAIVVLSVLVIVAAGAAYIWFSGGSGDASTAITAPVLTLEDGDTRSLLSIDASQSEVRFIIDEILVGQPKTVVGVTSEVAGEMLIDFDTPANSVIGGVRINVRTLKTDNEFRNRALRGQILQADRPEFEFAEFIPTDLIDMPADITIGESFTVKIEGQLTIRGISHTVVFEATVTPVSADELEIFATATVRYSDFGMSIPEAPGVAGVSEDVRLEIDLAATTASS